MKKGQLLSQPFVWIFALVLGALIMVWGIKTVMDLKGTADTVDLGRFKNSFQTKAKAFQNMGEGSKDFMKVDLSGAVKFVCFTDPENRENIKTSTCRYKSSDNSLKKCRSLAAMNGDDDVIEKVLQREKEKNMWFLPLGTAEIDRFKVAYAKPVSKDDDGPVYMVCYPNGREIVMEALSSHTELK